MNDPHFKRFFRDKSGGNTDSLGMDYQAAGLIIENAKFPSEYKEVVVMYIHPYTGEVHRSWRAKKEIEIFEYTDNDVQWYVWDEMKKRMEFLEKMDIEEGMKS